MRPTRCTSSNEARRNFASPGSPGSVRTARVVGGGAGLPTRSATRSPPCSARGSAPSGGARTERGARLPGSLRKETEPSTMSCVRLSWISRGRAFAAPNDARPVIDRRRRRGRRRARATPQRTFREVDFRVEAEPALPNVTLNSSESCGAPQPAPHMPQDPAGPNGKVT